MTDEQAVALTLATGVRSLARPDFFSLPGDQQKAILEEEQLEAEARPMDYGAEALMVLDVALKIIGVAGSIESAVSLVTGVPALVDAAKTL